MKRVTRCLSVLSFLVVAAVLAGCGGSSVGVTLSPAAAESIDQGQQVAITATVTNDASNSGVTWACTGAACTTLTSSTTSATFAASGATGTATITATSVKQPTASASVTITVDAPPSTTTTQGQLTADPATAGQNYSFSLTASGGAGTLAWTATGLTDGLTINSTTGIVSGTPTAQGTVTFTYTVTDSSAAGPMSATSGSLSITVNNPPAPAITTTQAQVPNGTAGTAYSFAFQATGSGTLTWSATGLPADGLSLNTSNGTVSGTPTSAQTINVTLTVSDNYSQSASKAFTITVNNPPAPTITTSQSDVTNVGPAIVGTTYTFTFQGTGSGTLTWSATGLPADGLSLNTSTGVVSGTPTTAQSVPFTLTLHDSYGQSSSSAAFTITVNNPPPALSVTKTHTGNFNQGQVGATYTVTVSNSNNAGTGPTDGSLVTVTDTLPSGETLVSMAGTGWTCVTNTCTRSDVLAAGASYPDITVTVDVSSTAPTPQVNQVSVSGGGSASANASDSTTIIEPVLSVTKTHTGNFTQGQQNATYTVNVSNVGTASTSGTVTLTETVPTGMTLVSMAGTNWTCGNPNAANVCTRGDALAAGASYDPVTVTVNVDLNASSPLVNQVVASGGGSVNATASDSTVINPSCGSGSESLLNGHYAFLLTGFDNGSPAEPALVGGVLNLDGSGSITAGTMDMNLASGFVNGLSVSSGSYTIGSDHRGCMTLTTSLGTQHYVFSVGGIGGMTAGVASTGHMIDFDTTGPFTSGVLRQQDTSAFSTSQVTGKYAFGVSAPINTTDCTNNSECGKFGAVGVFNLSTGTVTGGEVDYNAGGNVDGSLTAFPASPGSINNGGSYTVGGTDGRGTLIFNPGSSNNVTATIYVVSASDVLVMGDDDQTQNTIFAGEMLKQQSGSFSSSSLSGNYILYNSALSSSSGDTKVSIIRFNASGGNLSATIQQNDGATFTSQSGTGTYTVDSSSGRSLWSLSGSSNNPVVYLVNANQGFFLNSNGGVESGAFQSQTGSPFSASSANGTYAFGTINPETSNVSDNSGAAMFDGTSQITGSSDTNSKGTLDAGQAINNQSYTIDSNGLGISPSTCTISATSTNCQIIFYVISPSKAVVIDPTSPNASVQTADK